ncbi:MAG: UDP-4-amino-4,6-dideoxy-N-acetyl-beta-L-altrosamine transaminase [Deltaproteobacteria bacterium]|nr:UDP-4-amino-4,6-dideoxy-N-acetyl-beta-L-altrosamine transaminase [Deltaproteobacteria bacterium]
MTSFFPLTSCGSWCVRDSRKGCSVSDASGFIPYARQTIDSDDIAAVTAALRSDLITTGPVVRTFETEMCDFLHVPYGVAVSNGTAALHAAVYAAGVGDGDEVIVSPLTFAASANCVLYQRGTPIFADVDADTLLLKPTAVESKISKHTKAVIAVDYAGQPCDYTALRALCDRYHLTLIADCAHSPGAAFQNKSSAQWADIATYSFHPVKHLTSGEGGMVVTRSETLARRMRQFRNHGIDSDHLNRAAAGTFEYRMVTLGYNYRICDFQCALASSQLKKLAHWIERRRQIAAMYDDAFNSDERMAPLRVHHDAFHVYHLYVIRLATRYTAVDRRALFDQLRASGIGVNVHYLPVYRHDYYQQHFKGCSNNCPNADAAYDRIISIPMYSALSDQQVMRVISAVQKGLDSLSV